MTTKWIFECFAGELVCAAALPLVIFCGDFSRKESWIMEETHSQSCGPHCFSECIHYSCVLRLSLSHLRGINVFTLGNLCQGSCASKRLVSLWDMGESNRATRILLYVPLRVILLLCIGASVTVLPGHRKSKRAQQF